MNNIYSYPYNLIASEHCDQVHKKTCLLIAYAKTINSLSNLCLPRTTPDIHLLSATKEQRNKAVDIKAITEISTEALADSHVQDLFGALSNYPNVAHYKSYLLLFSSIVDYKLHQKCLKQAILCFPEEADLYYYYDIFKSTFLNPHHAVATRERLYQLLSLITKDRPGITLFTPLLGVSIGHLYLLLQALPRLPKMKFCIIYTKYSKGNALIRYLIRRGIIDELLQYEQLETLSVARLSRYININITCFAKDCLANTNHPSDMIGELSKSNSPAKHYMIHFRTEDYKKQNAYHTLLRNSSFPDVQNFVKHLALVHNIDIIRITTEEMSVKSFDKEHLVKCPTSEMAQYKLLASSALNIVGASGILGLAPYLGKKLMIIDSVNMFMHHALPVDHIIAMMHLTDIIDTDMLNNLSMSNLLALLTVSWVEPSGIMSYFSFRPLRQSQLIECFNHFHSSPNIYTIQQIYSRYGVQYPFPHDKQRILAKSTYENLTEFIDASLPYLGSNNVSLKMNSPMWC